MVLGIHRPEGTYIGAPKPERKIFPDDVLLLYGRVEAIKRLDERGQSTAQREHEEAVAEQERIAAEEARADALKQEPGTLTYKG